MKIEIKEITAGDVIFSLEEKNNSIKLTVEAAIKLKINLRYANLSSADLSYADLSSADLRYANLSSADLSSADLSYANLRYADLSYANLRSANLSYADLRYADLRYADLSSANLSSATGNRNEIKSIHILEYDVSFSLKEKTLAIGCQQHTFSEWKELTDKQINKMDSGALVWWKKWKDFIFMAIELSEVKDEN